MFAVKVLFPFLLFIISSCSMDKSMKGHDGMGDMSSPTSTPITEIDFDALFVVNGEDSTISVINTTQSKEATKIELKNISYPHHINLSPDKTMLAVGVPGMDLSGGHGMGGMAGMAYAVMVLEAKTGKTIAAKKLTDMTHNAIFSPNGTEVWASQMIEKGSVLVMDAMTLEQKNSISVGDMPAEISFSHDGKYAFVANGGSNSVSVIKVSDKSVVKTISVGEEPVGAWMGNDNIMYVDTEKGQTIEAIDASSLEKIKTYTLGFTPGMAARSITTEELWVSDNDNGQVVYFDIKTAEKLGAITTGKGAHGVVFSPTGDLSYVTNQGEGTLTIIDVTSHAVKKTINVGKKPNGLAFKTK